MARPRVRRLSESARDERASTQVAALLRRILETTREKAVVVCEMVGVLRILKDWARSAFGASVVAMIDGKVGKAADRARRLRSLNAADSDLRVLFLSKRCTEGITCVGANHLIELGPSWNPVTDVQALGRIQRFGQTRPCHVVRVVICGSIEELILLRQADKSGLVELAVFEVSDPEVCSRISDTVRGGGAAATGVRDDAMDSDDEPAADEPAQSVVE
ncbi:hypothetical protein JL721_11146 [Aureococcus anophagefferens]|nr:hypothetical protein JL721_11146 [Aureococcus anophagefferens]